MSRDDIMGRVRRAIQRRLARWLGRRPFRMPDGPAIVSFTFDDFPRSALSQGGRILERYACAGTYYTSLGLAGQTTVTGEIFEHGDLEKLL
jgi:hypothetical protein